MRKKISALLIGSILCVPVVSSAVSQYPASDLQALIAQLMEQIVRLQEQVRLLEQGRTPTVTPPLTPGCITLTRTLISGDTDAKTGGEISKLQNFLAQYPSIYPEGSVTGYFGDATASAVKKWQASVGIVASGGASVGPKTREAMLKCTPVTVRPQTATFSAVPTSGAAPLTVTFKARSNSSSGTYVLDVGDGTSKNMERVYGICSMNDSDSPCNGGPDLRVVHTYTTNGTYNATLYKLSGGYEPTFFSNSCTGDCAVIAGIAAAPPREFVGTVTITVGGTGGSISISGLDAPNSLTVGQGGTWKVHASAPTGTQLSYSVVWGDESSSLPWSASSGAASITTSSSFTHTYTNAGTYTPIFTVSSAAGSAKTSGTVVVTGGTTNSKFSASPTSGGAPLAVTFSSMIGGGLSPYYNEYRIHFGDGTSEIAQSCFAPADFCMSPGKNTHTYSASGTYTATLVYTRNSCPPATSGGVSCLGISAPETIGSATVTVGVGTSAPTIIFQAPVAGQTYVNGFEARWSVSSLPADSRMALQLVGDTTGTIVKSATADPAHGAAAISWNSFCNANFSDALGPCSMYLGKDSTYHLKAWIYTPANACFGYCMASGIPTKILAEVNSGSFRIESEDPISSATSGTGEPNVANALTALESALRGLLGKLAN